MWTDAMLIDEMWTDELKNRYPIITDIRVDDEGWVKVWFILNSTKLFANTPSVKDDIADYCEKCIKILKEALL